MIFTQDESTIIYTAAPFTGEGESLYVTLGTEVQYRDMSLDFGTSLGPMPDVTKTSRVNFVTSPATGITFAIDPAWEDQTISVDVRTFKDNVENESRHQQAITLVGTTATSTIDGTATLLDVEQRDGGVVRIRFIWTAAITGLQPETFTAIRTAGPTSPDDVELAYSGERLVEIDTEALSDASAYTFKIQATSGAVTLDVLTGIVFTADATGPTAPTVAAREW